MSTHNQNEPDTAQLQQQLHTIQAVHRLTMALARIDELVPLIQHLVSEVHTMLDLQSVLLLVLDDDDHKLTFGASSPPLTDATSASLPPITLEQGHNTPIISTWLQGRTYSGDASGIPFDALRTILTSAGTTGFFSVPMLVDEHLVGVLILSEADDRSMDTSDHDLLRHLADSTAVILANRRVQRQTVQQMAEAMNESYILQQIDHELNDNIALPRVFDMALDWALRFTNANAATIALYDRDADHLTVMHDYGHTTQQSDGLAQDVDTLAQRVARTGKLHMIGSVDEDASRENLPAGVQSQLAVPVIRDEQVIAVIVLDSKKANGFTSQHISFMQKLASRAAVAIDNARLYTETENERQRLSTILSSITDVVIVIDTNQQITMISQSAINALRLSPDEAYAGRHFSSTIQHPPLQKLYQQAYEAHQGVEDEITLPNDKVYYVKAVPMTAVGYAIVMQDVTPYKEMDQLKSELIATVSHDLKQPLGVMHGYIDLLKMKNDFDDTSLRFVERLNGAITNMRNLIDDLLDLARIESGTDLQQEQVSLRGLLQECVAMNHAQANEKQMTLRHELPEYLDYVRGEYTRLQQVFNNLISNAIKYTPAQGQVIVRAEQQQDAIQVAIEDDGMGISPEDQAHIFERFYRVRRPETYHIEGTGMGLAIVKKLVEAHGGKVRLESQLGSGTTFYVSLPADSG